MNKSPENVVVGIALCIVVVCWGAATIANNKNNFAGWWLGICDVIAVYAICRSISRDRIR